MWLWGREKPTVTILLATLAAFAGVLVIVMGSIGSINLTGDALLSAFETPLAPVWAWMLFSEVLATLTLVGGAIVLVAVYGSQLLK